MTENTRETQSNQKKVWQKPEVYVLDRDEVNKGNTHAREASFSTPANINGAGGHPGYTYWNAHGGVKNDYVS